MQKTNKVQHQYYAWCGVIGPLLFVGVFTLEGLLRTGYDSFKMYISALALGPRGWIQLGNFIAIGLLILAFTRGLAAEFPTGRASRAGLILMVILALLFIISGIFVMDPMDTPPAQMTISGLIHGLAGGFVFILMPIIIFVYFFHFRKDSRWQAFQWFTLILGIIEALNVVFFSAVSKSPAALVIFKDWLGLLQRAALVPFMFWLFVFAMQLLKRFKKD